MVAQTDQRFYFIEMPYREKRAGNPALHYGILRNNLFPYIYEQLIVTVYSTDVSL